MKKFLNKNVILCVTGGIAAYKTPEIIRLFKKEGADVRVIMTNSAKEFITPLTLQAVSGNTIHENLIDINAEAAMGHIELAKWADIIIVAPCTAETMSRISLGRADDLLCAVLLASNASKYIAPAMNQQMWTNLATQSNFKNMLNNNYIFIGPDAGEQACGDIGPGRLVEPFRIVDEIIDNELNGELSNFKVVITAGPTRENIDPIRYISNKSSGKMGYALASAAKELGAEVHLVSGPVNLMPPEGVNLVPVKSANEMLKAVLLMMEDSDFFISCAAVSDYKPIKKFDEKIKKENKMLNNLRLEETEDILKSVSDRFNNAYILGFAAETSNIEENALKKLSSKKINAIVANDVSNKDIGFDSDENEVTIFTTKSNIKLQKKEKIRIAREILDFVVNDFKKLKNV